MVCAIVSAKSWQTIFEAARFPFRANPNDYSGSRRLISVSGDPGSYVEKIPNNLKLFLFFWREHACFALPLLPHNFPFPCPPTRRVRPQEDSKFQASSVTEQHPSVRAEDRT